MTDASSGSSSSETISHGLVAGPPRLPVELWTIVCDKLEYGDLKRFGGACKAFQRLVQGARYDRKLFREKPGSRLARGTKLAIHPMLDVIDCLGQDASKAEILAPTQPPEDPDWADKPDILYEPDYFNGFDYKAADEFATAPACTKLHIQMAEIDCGTISSSTGVTVRQVAKACIKYWSSPVTGREKRHFLENNTGFYSASDRITRVDLLYDHRFFEGWSEARADAKGAVVPSTYGFGS